MISLDRVSFGYRRSVSVFELFSHTFIGGTMTAITGNSGRGKSTLLYLIGLLLRPSSGTITLAGDEVSTICDADRSCLRSEQIGFVFQDAVLDQSRSVLDNVLEGGVYAGVSSRHLRRAALELLDQHGVAVEPTRRANGISGGQAQRVALCRALLRHPSVLLADEPTGNLDRDNADVVLGSLRAAADSGAAVVIATHDPMVTKWCDELVEL